MTDRIEPGQTYRRYHPHERAVTRIRVQAVAPDGNRAWVVDADTGKRGRWILTSNLHANPTTRDGQPRRTGYVRETP